MSDPVRSTPEPVVLSQRMAAGESFTALFKEGMALVEATAAYLDGPGRTEAKRLTRAAALTYATESMRLTTRLMQLASWLLLQRAVNEGELSPEQARTEKTKVKLTRFDPPPADALAALPKRLAALIDQARQLHDQVTRLDALIYRKAAVEPAANPIELQMGLLRAAFEAAQQRR
jgi:regulator of CtrA degradation